ncbi:hypothetical protein P4O66_020006 [Electrophorus voltai]|uniref:Endonuclease/exonuclease/phosphatase domain-containing protein n=1 Tax=Electrophorus voltai TaxID=2609070 RepID=A0AAD8ZRM4_9TELE|nr:hypothetical protein P4O66_020006 [Electrophorus voltai]
MTFGLFLIASAALFQWLSPPHSQMSKFILSLVLNRASGRQKGMAESVGGSSVYPESRLFDLPAGDKEELIKQEKALPSPIVYVYVLCICCVCMLVSAQHQDAALIVVGDFNSVNLKRAVPNLYQHATFPTRGNRTLDHCYTPYKASYKALALHHLREVAHWTDQSVAALQDALDDADWGMFWYSTDDVSEFTQAVVGFIGKLVDDTISRATIKKFPNQKPWVDKTI